MPTCEGDRCRSKKRAVERDDGRKLCDRCESQRQREQQSDDDGTSASNGNIITDAEQIVNEMLTYCLFHQKNSSSSAIKRVVMDFYTPEEIREAKQTLWDAYGEDVLGVTPSRHDIQGRDAHDKEVDDILLAAATIDAGVEAAEQVTFVAANLGRLPRVAPEELDLTSVVMRLTQLERTYASLERKVASNTDSVAAILEVQLQTSSYSVAAQQHVSHVMPGGHVRPATALMKSQPRDAGRVASADVNTPAMAPGHQQQTPAQAKTTSTNGPGGCDAPHDNDDGENRDVGGDGFQVSRQQRLREQKQAKRSSRKAVYGSGSNAALRAGKQTREVFVFNLDGATTAEELTEFLNDIGIQTEQIECRSNENAVNKSFRIVINNNDYDKIMDSEIWPARVGIRPYYRKRVVTERKQNNADS